jgi:hypothetical protein
MSSDPESKPAGKRRLYAKEPRKADAGEPFIRFIDGF